MHHHHPHHHACGGSHRDRTPLPVRVTHHQSLIIFNAKHHKNAHITVDAHVNDFTLRIDAPKSGRAGRIAIEAGHAISIALTTSGSDMIIKPVTNIHVTAPIVLDYYGSMNTLFITHHVPVVGSAPLGEIHLGEREPTDGTQGGTNADDPTEAPTYTPP